MKKNNGGPNAWKLEDLVDHCVKGEAYAGIQTEAGAKWVPARPIGLDTLRHRLSLALDVFRGKADAVYWDGQ